MKKKHLTYKQPLGFITPESYFDNFSAGLFSKLNKEPLAEKKIATGFGVPENYFQKINLSLPNEKESKVFSLFNRRNIKHVASIAAMLLLMLSVFNVNESEKISFSTIGYESVKSYIENDNFDLTKPAIERILSQNAHLSELEFKTIDNKAIFDYFTRNSSGITFINH